MKTIKINVTYCNSANIPTGVPYEQIRPFYSITKEMECDKELTSLEMKGHVKDLKDLIDGMIMEDIKNNRNKLAEIKK